MSELLNALTAYMSSRGYVPMKPAEIIEEIQILKRMGGDWPEASEALWLAAVDDGIKRRLFVKEFDYVKLAPMPVDKPQEAPTQLELF